MSDIAQLQGDFTELDAQLRQAQATQAATPHGTAEWVDLQRTIGDLRRRTLLAEQALVQAKIAGLPPKARGGTQDVSLGNRLYFIERELQSQVPQPVPERTMMKIHHPDTNYGFNQ